MRPSGILSTLSLLLLLWVDCRHISASTLSSKDNEPLKETSSLGGQKIAIIGGGIAGTFTSKYLAEYDVKHAKSSSKEDDDCLVEKIVVFDVSPPPPEFSSSGPVDQIPQQSSSTQSSIQSSIQSSADPLPPGWQGSRVANIQLQDGSIVELGASIVYNGNKFVMEMMEGDPQRLKKGSPLGTGKVKQTKSQQQQQATPTGFGIYHGEGQWLMKTFDFSPLYPKWIKSLYLVWRYNIDLFRMQQAVKRAVHAFDLIYQLLNDTAHEVSYFQSPMDMWEALGLRSSANITFHDFLDGLGLSRDPTSDDAVCALPWWRRWLPGQGCFRSELVTAMTLNTYNQDLSEMNGLVGLVAYVPAGGELFSVEGGNHLLMESALHQAKKLYESSKCSASINANNETARIQRRQKIITTVVSDDTSIELWSNQEYLGSYNIVILAAPLQQSRINFLIKSHMDPAALHPMPLGGMHENKDFDERKEVSSTNTNRAASNEFGDLTFASPLPPSATTPYTSVVTTVVSNATLNLTHFQLDNAISAPSPIPRSILVSENGKKSEGITTLTILSLEDGLCKTFSSEILSDSYRNTIFGPYHTVEYIQEWSGEHGGATPAFRGGRTSQSLPYLLYDAGVNLGSQNEGGKTAGGGPALYYVNAIESAVAAIEISAIGAKSTAKLVARRMGLLNPDKRKLSHDEL